MLLEQKARFTNTSAISTYLRTWATGGDPCVDDWMSVTCSDGSVTELCGPNRLQRACVFAMHMKEADFVHVYYWFAYMYVRPDS